MTSVGDAAKEVYFQSTNEKNETSQLQLDHGSDCRTKECPVVKGRKVPGVCG